MGRTLDSQSSQLHYEFIIGVRSIQCHQTTENNNNWQSARANRQWSADYPADNTTLQRTGDNITRMGSEYTQHDLASSFRPISRALQCFGFDLDQAGPRSIFRRVAFLLVCLSLLVFICVANSLGIHQFLEYRRDAEYAYYWYLFSTAIVNILSELARFTTSVFKWETLWKKLQASDQYIGCPARFYAQIGKTNRFFIIGVVISVRIFSFKSNFPVTKYHQTGNHPDYKATSTKLP